MHGKNHHRAGSFARHVPWLDLLLPDGQELRVTPGSHPDLFWATTGEMGLTGVIVSAGLQLIPVETASLLVDTIRTADLDGTMACLAEADERYGYTVAWLDCLAAGRNLGRSVVTSGDFAARADLPPRARRDPLAFNPPAWLRAPAACPPGLVNRYTVALANEGLVPEGPSPPRGRDPDHRRLLPSARRHQELEQGLRLSRVPAVSVRRGSATSRCCAACLSRSAPPGRRRRDGAEAIRAGR